MPLAAPLLFFEISDVASLTHAYHDCQRLYELSLCDLNGKSCLHTQTCSMKND